VSLSILGTFKYTGELMKKRFVKLVMMPILVGFFFSLCSCDARRSDALIIAASANMQYATEELAEAFTDSTGLPCELIIASSGKLTAQIIEGAPFDLFLSADMKYPQKIFEEGLAYQAPEVYAYGYLVFWSLNGAQDLSETGLISDEVTHIAIANPETAPYGAAALELLRRMGILEEVRQKLVFGESIAQTNQFIFSGSAQIGITARSVVSSPAAKGRGRWIEAENSLYNPIAQGLVVLKNDRESLDRALAFSAFLRSPAAKEILHKFGYGLD
jgi:molybdate transport system substrate-binding protein